MKVNLPWYATTDANYWIARTMVGVVTIKAKTSAPWYLRVSATTLGYTVFLAGKRVSWTTDLLTAQTIAGQVVRDELRRRFPLCFTA